MPAQKTLNRLNILWAAALPFAVLTLAGCEAPAPNANTTAMHGHGSAMDNDEAKGPHGGRLLKQGDFAVELRVDEAGRPPRWQAYAFNQGQPVDAGAVQLSVTTQRLDGDEHRFVLVSEGEARVSEDVVIEPHSFDVSVDAQYQGQNYHWQFASPEGRSHISTAMAEKMGITAEPVGPQHIAEYVEVLGRVDFAPNALVTLRAQFPGRVLEVLKGEGDAVQKGDVLARIEASESLRSYAVRATMDGLVIQRGTNSGDVVDMAALFVIGDPTKLRVAFHIYPGDFSRVRPGQPVMIKSVDGAWEAQSQIAAYLPTTEAATQTLIAYAPLANEDNHWLPGMIVTGQVETNAVEVPLAVRTQALQRFRDWPVVFAQIGEDYEVRMLELGRQNEQWSEVLGGIKPGQVYVTENSFVIKADIEKEGASHDH